MRILQLVAGEKWTGAAAVVFDQTAALVAAGVEAQFAFVSNSLLERRLLPLGWARPLLTRPTGPFDYVQDAARLRATIRRERFDLVLRRRDYFEPGPQALFKLARGPEFASRAAALGGYEVADSGTVLLNR